MRKVTKFGDLYFHISNVKLKFVTFYRLKRIRSNNTVQIPFFSLSVCSFSQIKTKDYISGVVCTPLFHCPRCKNHWTEFGTLPEDCQFPRQPTRGPVIHLASKRKPHFEARKRKTKRRLGYLDIMLFY